MRILAVDLGEKNLGIALSDPTGTIAFPLTVLKHFSRPVNAASIAQLAQEQGAERIVIGEALDDENQPTHQSRRARKLAAAIKSQCKTPVVLWDESGSTQVARQTRIAMGVPRRQRQGHMDELAATVILQSYLEAHPEVRE